MEVIILAGGLGTRLRPAVSDIPKCLAPVAGVPFLEYLLEWLQNAGATRIIFSIGYLGEQVKEQVNSKERPFEAVWACEDTPLGTGGAIRAALSMAREECIYVVNGDTFFPVSLADMPLAAPITLALKPMKDFDRYGAVDVSGGKVTAFREKQFCKEGLINGGVYALRKSLLDLQAFPEKFSFEKEILEPYAEKGLVDACICDSFFIDIGIPEDYRKSMQLIPEYVFTAEASARVLGSGADTLFLDRDGVINRKIDGDYVRSPEQFVFRCGILEQMKAWASAFRHIIIVTNQRGVGRGLMSDKDLADVHSAMLDAIISSGGRVDAIFTCTSADESDPRRKPAPGMFYDAIALFPDIKAEKSVMIGDSDSDKAFAQACGISFVKMK